MNASDVRTLYAYNRWASERMFAALEKLSDEKLSAVAISSFPSLRESVFHILAAEWLWLKRWKGDSPQAPIAAYRAFRRSVERPDAARQAEL